MIKDTQIFTGVDEFLKRYKCHTENLSNGSSEEMLSKSGVWLKFKDHSQMVNVCAVDEKGIFLMDRFVNWKDLAEYYVFLDGSPCCG